MEGHMRLHYFFLLFLVPIITYAGQKGKVNNIQTETISSQAYKFKQPASFKMRVWESNNSTLGRVAGGSTAQSTPPDGFGIEYPTGSGIEHIFGAGPWIGAIIDTALPGNPPSKIMAVTTGYEGWSGPYLEFFGNPDGRDSFFITSIHDHNGYNRRGFDDDGDGKIDEDELDGVDNDGDGLIDEDYGAVSECDAYVGYTDTATTPIVQGHVPLGIKVWQRSFAWRTLVKEPILPFEYYFINVGNKILDSVYVGFFADCDVGPWDISSYYQRNSSGYLYDVRCAYVANPIDRPGTPIGIVVGSASIPLDQLRYTFQWYPGPASPPNDAARYRLMSLGQIKPDEFPSVSDTRFFISLGPFAEMKQGDTLKIVVGLISGEGVREGRNNLHDNAAKFLEIVYRGYTFPAVPPSPPLWFDVGKDRVTLHWSWPPKDTLDLRSRFQCDPLQTWDDSNKSVSALPDTHWRKRNPELRCGYIGTGGQSGGRIFEGFRVWRSDPYGYPSSFNLIAEYDVKDDMGFGNQTGLQYSLVDSGLIPGCRYWYAVTSFSIPGLTLVYVVDTITHTVRIDTLESPPMESDITENITMNDFPSGGIVDDYSLPQRFQLYQSSPNPANPTAKIRFDLPEYCIVSLKMFDILGREVMTLTEGFFPAGSHTVNVDLSNMASALYFYRIEATSTSDPSKTFTQVKKILLLK
jgi:hypothetical protein